MDTAIKTVESKISMENFFATIMLVGMLGIFITALNTAVGVCNPGYITWVGISQQAFALTSIVFFAVGVVGLLIRHVLQKRRFSEKEDVFLKKKTFF